MIKEMIMKNLELEKQAQEESKKWAYLISVLREQEGNKKEECDSCSS